MIEEVDSASNSSRTENRVHDLRPSRENVREVFEKAGSVELKGVRKTEVVSAWPQIPCSMCSARMRNVGKQRSNAGRATQVPRCIYLERWTAAGRHRVYDLLRRRHMYDHVTSDQERR